jgi:hypothetical protein
LGVTGQQRVGEILNRDFSVDVVDAPDAVVLLLRPGFVGRSRTEGGSQLGDLAVMPDHQHYFASVLTAEKSGCQGAVVVVTEAVIDWQMEGVASGVTVWMGRLEWGLSRVAKST